MVYINNLSHVLQRIQSISFTRLEDLNKPRHNESNVPLSLGFEKTCFNGTACNNTSFHLDRAERELCGVVTWEQAAGSIPYSH
jgi:hypothetical protein